MEQFVFFWEKDSVAAVNIETSWLGVVLVVVEEGLVLLSGVEGGVG